MAILKDSIVQGSMRITDTLYTDNLDTNLLSADELISPLLSLKTTINSASSTTEGINLYTNNSIVGHIGTSNAIGIYSTGPIYLRPGNGTISASYGATLSYEYFQPITSLALSLGTSSTRWNGVYSSTGDFTGTLTLSKATDASGTANNSPALIVGGTATTNPHLELDGNEIMSKTSGTTVGPLYLNNDGGAVYINRGYGLTSVSTAVEDSGLRVYARRANNQGIIEAYNGYAAGNGTYSWGYNHLTPNIAAGANTCLLTGVANSTNNQGALEFHYAGSNHADNYVGLGLYGNNGLLKIFKDKHVEIDTLTLKNQEAVGHLNFSRSGNWNYILFPSAANSVLSISQDVGSANGLLIVDGNTVSSPKGSSLGSTSYIWGSIYNKGYNYHYANNSQYISTVYANEAKTTLGEFFYDAGNKTNISKGQFGLIEWAPNSTADTSTSGHYERYLFPAATAGLAEDKTYNVLTTKSKITVAQGGTGATSFTNDCAIVATGTTQTLASRGLKITGGTNENVVITSYGSGKTLTVESSDTLILNKPATSSISFRSAGTVIGQFNRNGSLQLGNETNATQTDYKLYVRDGNIGLTGKIAFNTNITTEKASIQYIDSGLFKRGTVFTASSSTAAGGNGTNGYTGARWVFNLGITTLSDGDTITIKVPVASHDYGTYISVDNGTTFKPIGVLGSTTRLAGQYGVNSILTLTYDSDGQTNSVFPTGVGTDTASTSRKNVTGGCWRVVNYYDSGNDGLWYARYYSFKAQTAITGVHVVGGTSSGYNNVDSGTPFDIRYPVMYASGNIAAGSANNYGYIFHYAVSIKNSSETNVTFTSYRPIYIKGTISGTTFTPIPGGNPYVDTIAETDDGYVYYYIGRSYGASSMTFDATGSKMYQYKNGEVRPYTIVQKLQSGAFHDGYAYAGADGGLEIGPSIDLHSSITGTDDYTARISVDSSNIRLTGKQTKVDSLVSSGSVYIGNFATNTAQSQEYAMTVASGAGRIYMYSQAEITGVRGIYGSNAANSYAAVLTVDQNNKISSLAEISGTMVLSKTQSASGTSNNNPALIVGGAASSTHLEFDHNQIMAKASGTTTADLFINNNGGKVWTGGNLHVKTACISLRNPVKKGTTPSAEQVASLIFFESGTGLELANYTGTVYNSVSTSNETQTCLAAYKSAANSTASAYFGVAYLADDTLRTQTNAKVYGAVWNDYAEYRASNAKEPGRVLTEDTDGIMKITTKRLMPACKVYSDTFGMAIGQTTKDNTPIAVSGRVLVYPYRNRMEYHLGDAVCSAPNGTIDIMTREEIMMYPERIIGTVSEIPNYEEWECGYNNKNDKKQYIKVNGCIWIYVR